MADNTGPYRPCYDLTTLQSREVAIKIEVKRFEKYMRIIDRTLQLVEKMGSKGEKGVS